MRGVTKFTPRDGAAKGSTPGSYAGLVPATSATPTTPAANAAAITAALGRGSRWDVRTIASTGSTNRDVAALAVAGAAQGVVLIAEHQSGGRGRFDRVWQAPPGASIAVSVLLRPRRPLQDWGWLSLLAGMAVARAVRSATTITPHDAARVLLKWPNDVLVGSGSGAGKLCGILTERHETATGPAAVIGMGINIDLAPEELPVPTATSLAGAGFRPDKDALLVALLGELGELYEVWQQRGNLREAYERDCGTLGQQVRVELTPTTSVTGRASGIDASGALVVQTPTGPATFMAGDVHHLRPSG